MNDLLFGASKENITPPAGFIPRLYGLQGTRFAGVIDELYVRVMIISNGESKTMFVSWDLDKAPIPEVIVPALSSQSGIPEDHIMYFAVHTHTAPLHSARPADGPNAKALQGAETIAATNEYEMLLKEAALKAAASAVSSMVSAKIGWATGKSYIGEYRLQDYFTELSDGTVQKITALGSDPSRDIDRTLFVMRIEDLTGNVLGFFVNHAVHCCVMIRNNFDGKGGVGISADIAGQVSTLLEERYPGCTALWSSGAAGDINPVMMNQYNIADPVTGAPVEYTEFNTAEPAQLMLLLMSRRQFADVLAANRNISCDTVSADISGANTIIYDPSPADDEAPYQVRLQAVKIGPLYFCGASGELFGSIGQAIKEVSPAPYTVVINHECSLLKDSGYIFDDEAFEKCTLPDGRRDGLPDICDTRLRPGYIKQAIEDGAKKLFTRLL